MLSVHKFANISKTEKCEWFKSLIKLLTNVLFLCFMFLDSELFWMKIFVFIQVQFDEKIVFIAF